MTQLASEQTVNQLSLHFDHVPEIDLTEELQATIKTYKEMRKHPQIALGLAIKSAPIRSLKWKITGSDQTRVDLMVEQLQPLWNRLLRMMLTSWSFGFQVFEKVYEIENGRLMLKKLKDLDPQFIHFVYGTHGEFLGIIQKGSGLFKDEVFLPPEKVFVYSNDPEWGNLRGISLLINVLKDYARQKKIFDKVWIPYLMHGSTRMMIGKCPPGDITIGANAHLNTTAGKVNAAEHMGRLMQKLLSGGAVVIPKTFHKGTGTEEWEIELLEDKSQRVVPLKEAVEYYDKLLMRGLLIPDRVANQEGTTGSFGLVQKLVDFFITSLINTVKDINEHINRFIIEPWEKLNFLEPSDLKFELATITPKTIEFLQDMMERTLSMPIGIEVLSDRIDWKEVFEELEVPFNDNADEDQDIIGLLKEIAQAGVNPRSTS